MYKLLTTTALALVLGGATAMAQSDEPMPANQPQAEVGVDSADSSVTWKKQEGAVLTDDLIGTDVVNRNDEKLGEIEELLVALDAGGADAGGAMGTTPQATLPADEPLAQVGEAPADATDMPGDTSMTGDTSDMAAADTEGEGIAGSVDGADSGIGNDSAELNEPETSAEPMDDIASSSDGAGNETMQTPDATDDLASDDLASSDGSDAGVSAPAGSDQADIGEPYDEGTDTAINETPMPETGISGTDTAANETLMAPSGDTGSQMAVSQIVIGVGGFLGIGEKRIALPADRFEFYSGDNGEQKIVLDMSKDELENLPAFVERDDGKMGEPAPATQVE